MLKNLSETKIKYLVYLSFLLIPIKLSFALICIIPLILIYLLRDFSLKDLFKYENKYISYFFIFAFLSSFCYLMPFKSIVALSSFCFYFFLIFAVVRYLPKEKILLSISLFGLGQTISSLHTILQEALGSDIIKDFFVGKLSESGQLAITLPLIFGVIFFNNEKLKRKEIIFSVLLFIISILSGFAYKYFDEYAIYLLLMFGLFLIIAISYVVKNRSLINIKNFILLYAPICSASFILNLKRGPWFGVGVAMLILLCKFYKKYVLPFIAISIVIFFSITPIRERVLSSENHFFISGGRASIWSVGTELMTRYPLGVGFKNSRNLSSYSIDIPSNLKHFHNNLLNIAVEFGVFNLFLYLAWIVLILKCAFSGNEQMFLLGLAILSTQIAGLVEYNIGDTEVFLVLLLTIGLLNILRCGKSEATNLCKISK